MSGDDAIARARAIGELDSVLARHPFGDSDYITAELHKSYERRIRALAARLPIAERLLDILKRAASCTRYLVIGDPVLRSAVQHAQVQVETGSAYGLPLAQCEELFGEAVRLLEQGGTALTGSGLTSRLGTERYHGWVWNDDPPDNMFTRAFRAVVHSDYDDADPCSPSADELATLQAGTRLLSEILPETSRSALSHTHIATVFPEAGAWRGRLSSSEFRIGGTIFLSRRILTNPWMAAEHLFHESLHQQLYDFRMSHTLLRPDFARDGAPMIHSPWNRPANRGNYWDVNRALAAYHVYVHISLLSTLAEYRANDLRHFGPVTMTGRRTALARTHYLRERLRAELWDELGDAGKRLVDWLSGILEVLDPSPPASGAHVHLLLDRYWQEANEVAALPGAGRVRPGLTDRLQGLLDVEIEGTRSVLAMMGKDCHPFDTALESLAGQDPTSRFLSVRTLVAETILSMCPDSFRLAETMKPDERVRDMVEDSSEILGRLLEA